MARWSITQNNWTPIAVADTTAFTNVGYFALQGGTTTQRISIWELYMGGLAATGAPAQMILARDSTTGATSLSGGTIAALDPASANLTSMPVQFSTSTTKPQRSSTLYLLTPAFNAFGGIVRWNASPGEEIGLVSTAATAGEISLSSASTGTPGLMSSHIIFEIF